MLKDGQETDMPQRVRLFVSSDCDSCDQAAMFIQVWSESHSDVDVEIVSVLSVPEDAVRWQILYTPALIIDDRVVVKPDLSVEQIADVLPD